MNIQGKRKMITRCRNQIDTKLNCRNINWTITKFIKLKKIEVCIVKKQKETNGVVSFCFS